MRAFPASAEADDTVYYALTPQTMPRAPRHRGYRGRWIARPRWYNAMERPPVGRRLDVASEERHGARAASDLLSRCPAVARAGRLDPGRSGEARAFLRPHPELPPADRAHPQPPFSRFGVSRAHRVERPRRAPRRESYRRHAAALVGRR